MSMNKQKLVQVSTLLAFNSKSILSLNPNTIAVSRKKNGQLGFRGIAFDLIPGNNPVF